MAYGGRLTSLAEAVCTLTLLQKSFTAAIGHDQRGQVGSKGHRGSALVAEYAVGTALEDCAFSPS